MREHAQHVLGVPIIFNAMIAWDCVPLLAGGVAALEDARPSSRQDVSQARCQSGKMSVRQDVSQASSRKMSVRQDVSKARCQ